MIWLATIGTMIAAGLTLYLLHAGFLAAMKRYRDVYTQDAGVRLSELFLFVDPLHLWTGSVLLCAAVGMVIYGVLDNAPLAALTALGVARVPGWWVKYLRRRRLAQFDHQLPVTLITLAAALRAGASVPIAFTHVVAHAEPPLSQEFGLMLREQRMGRSFDDALEALCRRMPSSSTALVASALGIAAQTGGNLAETLERIAASLTAQQRLRARVQALTAQGKLQAWIVGALPLALGVALTALDPHGMQPLWYTPMGWATLAVIAGLEMAGILMIRRIVRIDV